jgi:hypothetical protein
MKTQRTALTVLLFAAVLSTSLSVGAQASILIAHGSGASGDNDARHFGTVQSVPTLEQMLEPFNFQGVDSATYLISQGVMDEQLAGRGLGRTGRGFAGGQQIDSWYSAAEDRSVVCVGVAEGGRYSQTVYVMPGRIRRSDVVPLP